MQSCDTLAVCAQFSANGRNLFGKNSDRPVGEAQPLVFIPGGRHAPGEMKKCTYIEIDEAPETYAVLGSQPYWIWGFEIGVNEHGLVIGNEAQGSRNAKESKVGLLGMDLLRLGLERAKTARQAMDVITGLLTQYGQDANASQLFERKYENSYLLMDREEIWILETAGREWAAKQVRDMWAISNCYSIRRDMDLCSPGLREKALAEGWISADEPFDFAKAYTLPAVRQAYAVPRYQRMTDMLAEKTEHSFATVLGILRDHFENTPMAPRFGPTAGTLYSICMHPQTKDDSKTAAALMVTYDEALGLSMRHAFATPCLSAFMPVYFTGYLPACMQVGSECYREDSMWWQLERLNTAVSMDEQRFGDPVRKALAGLEAQLEEETAVLEAQAKDLLKDGARDRANALLNAHMDRCCDQILALCRKQTDAILAQAGKDFRGPTKDLLAWYDRRTQVLGLTE